MNPAKARDAVAATSTATRVPGPSMTELARLLAGLEVDRSARVADRLSRPVMREHARDIDHAWEQFRQQRLQPLSAFAARELSSLAASSGPVFYPFSGPDVVHALTLFPRASQFVLTGLEPVGAMPDIAALEGGDAARMLGDLRHALADLFGIGFFKTLHLRAEIRSRRYAGVLPILLVLLARMDASIGEVETLQLVEGARVVKTGASPPAGVPAGSISGVRIAFRMPGDHAERSLYYFATDLSDAGLARTPQYLQWVAKESPQATFLKAASYLMHGPSFPRIRSFVIDNSRLVVQDDSGIPLRYFPESRWERRMFGVYKGPISLFAHHKQPDLRRAYEEHARPLDFGIGYHSTKGASNLQVLTLR